MEAILQQDFSE